LSDVGVAQEFEITKADIFDNSWKFTEKLRIRIMRATGILLLLPTVSWADKSEFVADDAKLERLSFDGEFTEGPCAGPDGCIYFSDIGNRIMKYDPTTGKTTAFRDPSGRSNGLKFDSKGRLIACEGANTGGNRRISITEDGKVKSLADKYQDKMFNSPNDLALDAKGRIYFSDPRYIGNEKRELEHESIYRIDPDGTVTRVIDDVSKPNGLVLSPDQKTLYVAESNSDPKGKRELRAYPLKEDGSVGKMTVLHEFGEDRGIDGMTVSSDGHIIATAGKGNTAGVTIFTAEGKRVGFIPTPEVPTNCCFAGKDRAMLYITAGKSLYRIPTKMTGIDPTLAPKP
jgi:gluconolactonase